MPETLAPADRHVELTKRQLEIAMLVADGLTTKEIAARLDVIPKTVEYHRRAISKTIGNTPLVVRYLIRRHLLKP